MPVKTRNVQKVGTKFVTILAYLEQPKTKTSCQAIATTNEKQTLLPSSSAGPMEQKTTEAKRKNKQKGSSMTGPKNKNTLCQVITTTNEKQTLLPSSNAGAMEQEKAAAKKSPEFFQSRGKCSKALDFFPNQKNLIWLA